MRSLLVLCLALIPAALFGQNTGPQNTQPTNTDPTTLNCSVGKGILVYVYNNAGTAIQYTCGPSGHYIATPGGSTTACAGAVGGTCGANVIAGGANGIVKSTNSGATTTTATPGTDYVIPSGNVATATQLANLPTAAPSGQYCTGVLASGNCIPAQVNYSQLGGTNPAAAGAALGATALQPAGNGSSLTGLTYTQIGGTPVSPTQPPNTIAGNNTGSTASPTGLTAAQSNAITNSDTTVQAFAGPMTSPRLNNGYYYVDGYNTTNAPGIAQSQAAWSVSTSYPLCSSVNYTDGNNYMEVQTGGSIGVTPGTNQAIWYQVPINFASTPTTCAFYIAASWTQANNANADLWFGNSTFGTPYDVSAGLQEPPGSQWVVSLHGMARGINGSPTQLKASHSGVPGMIYRDYTPTGVSLPTNMVIENLDFNGGNIGSMCWQIYSVKASLFQRLSCENTTSAVTPWEFGGGNPPSGFQEGGFQNIIYDIFGSGAASPPSSWANITVSITAGVPSFTVVSGGSYLNAPNVRTAYFLGGSCTSTGTLSVTSSGSGPFVITGLTQSGYSGCTGTTPTVTFGDTGNTQYGGIISRWTDGTVRSVVEANVGYIYGLFMNGTGGNNVDHTHLYGSFSTQLKAGGDKYTNTEFDTVVNRAADSSSSANALWTDTDFATPGGGNQLPNITGFVFGSGGGAVTNSVCGNNSVSSPPFTLVQGPSGAIPYQGSYGNIHIINGTHCDTLQRESSFAGPVAVPSLVDTGLTASSSVCTDAGSTLITAGCANKVYASSYKGYASDTGTANNFVVALTDTSYTGAVVGSTFTMKALNSSTASSNIVINGGSARTMHGIGGAGTSSGSLTAGVLYNCVDDGTNINCTPWSGGTYLVPDNGVTIFNHATSLSNNFHFLANLLSGAVTLTVPNASGTLGLVLTGTTGSIGGGALLAGACTSGTVAVTSSTTAMAVQASPVTYPGDGNYWLAYVSTAGTVTVKVCGAVAGTPTASTYNVRVIQ